MNTDPKEYDIKYDINLLSVDILDDSITQEKLAEEGLGQEN